MVDIATGAISPYATASSTPLKMLDVGEPPEFKVGDCVEHYVDHAVGYITAPAKSDDGGDWLVQWVMRADGSPHGITHSTPWDNDQLHHYLVPGDTVKLLPIEDIWRKHSMKDRAGSTSVIKECASGATVVPYQSRSVDGLPCVLLDGGAYLWPLSRVRKVT